MQALDNMLGFIVKQPLHVTLRQMRIVQIALVISSQILLYRIVDNMKAWMLRRQQLLMECLQRLL
jgi:hypothetical protein